MENTIILASASPRRNELLRQVGFSFEIIPSLAEEREMPGETPEEHVIRLSLEKAREVSTRDDIDGRWIIGSDTIVLLDAEILGKPRDEEDAARMLRALSGRTHQVLSGYAILDRCTGENRAGAVTTRVTFRSLTAAEISGYIDTKEPVDKAGAYAIQGLGAFMVSRIEGSYSNVVGLPLCEVVQGLEALGAPVPCLSQPV
ncbi:Maf family protein [Geopsychrobacter electrodiphilus]|uniref:Maf family protein n=1 Tax=Geopsychrobacter electrodiphilus TaxID=225196 RepID=UPI000364125E|nr:Maf family protein [Geopsychrobacter electrodiphilus]